MDSDGHRHPPPVVPRAVGRATVPQQPQSSPLDSGSEPAAPPTAPLRAGAQSQALLSAAQHPQQSRGRRTATWWALIELVAVAALVVVVRFVPGAPLGDAAAPIWVAPPLRGGDRPAAKQPAPAPTPPPLPALRFRATTLTVTTEGFFSWALMDRRTGEIFGSPEMTGTTWPASMIKPWLASDDLRRLTENHRSPSAARLRELEAMIRDSDNAAAQAAYVRNGGVASIKRLIRRCGLTDTTASAKGWSFTEISARDAVRMADCIADGTAAGPQWTGWVLEMMRTVRVGDWGIRAALPAAEADQVSIKNGWLYYNDDRNWHINCMAVSDTWAMAVLQRYPGHGRWDSDFGFGRKVCRETATQLLNPEYVPGA